MVIGSEGEQFGLMKIEDALSLATEKELDLVEVSPNLNPPVCKLMDYGKQMYKVAKQKRQQNAKQKQTETKGIRLSVRIEKHDLTFKANNAVKFLKKGNKVKIDIVLRGREKAHQDLAFKKMKIFLDMIAEISKNDKEAAEREIIEEQSAKKTPQGISSIIEYKKR
ncbi:MAG: translation initiation factor IF-3 [Candidatus Pacebacteria bacterium]|nr:translation initiation factor IF-3 [Candidatus Paceibacterota bacterium]